MVYFKFVAIYCFFFFLVILFVVVEPCCRSDSSFTLIELSGTAKMKLTMRLLVLRTEGCVMFFSDLMFMIFAIMGRVLL
ncbi:hypothetical protein Hanom_Chr08g00708891 [Helianthus anomalus]